MAAHSERPGLVVAQPPEDSICQQAGFDRCVARLLDVLGAGIAICQVSGCLLYLNATGGRILGVSPSEVRGRDVSEFFASMEQLLEAVAASDTGMSAEIPIRSRHDKQLRIGYRLAETSGLIEPLAEVQRVLLFQDITESARIRHERDHLLRVATVSRLLPTIAHEIKNPLAGIQCLAESLQHELDRNDHKEDLRVILSEVERMRLIIDGLGLADGCLIEQCEQTDLAREVRELFRLLEPRARQLGIALRFEEEEPRPAAVNPGMLRLVLLNLMNNAIDACASGDAIAVKACRNNGRLEMTVADTGRGMSPETLRRATELFFTTRPRGSGIGLALIAQVVERAGGELDIESAPDRGTRVCLTIPQERSA
ncbi:MAG: GHKL domain-containing protein [bacterium]|nr:GHKL domain-containing protein [bacterium]